ncbi:MAG: hypothetical protein EKK53_26875 [Burkholderiales bacterium]|nr:MAG: hypothetical protein EKK53_26875 [Burkholderiales bacterium]
MQPSRGRLAPFLVCGMTCALLAFVCIAARRSYATFVVPAPVASLLVLAGCGAVAGFARDRPCAWRGLWLLAALLAALAAWQVFMALLGSPIQSNDPAERLFVLWGSFLLWVAATALLGLAAVVALVFAWLFGRPRAMVHRAQDE